VLGLLVAVLSRKLGMRKQAVYLEPECFALQQKPSYCLPYPLVSY